MTIATDVVEVLNDLTELTIDLIQVIKHHNILKIMDAVKAYKEMIKDAKVALPELQHMDPETATAVLNAAYLDIKKILAAI